MGMTVKGQMIITFLKIQRSQDREIQTKSPKLTFFKVSTGLCLFNISHATGFPVKRLEEFPNSTEN